jgi:hypothetical protein
MDINQKGKNMHKKIMSEAAKDLTKDAVKYKNKVRTAKTTKKKKHEQIEEAEAASAAKDMKKRAKSAHEFK